MKQGHWNSCIRTIQNLYMGWILACIIRGFLRVEGIVNWRIGRLCRVDGMEGCWFGIGINLNQKLLNWDLKKGFLKMIKRERFKKRNKVICLLNNYCICIKIENIEKEIVWIRKKFNFFSLKFKYLGMSLKDNAKPKKWCKICKKIICERNELDLNISPPEEPKFIWNFFHQISTFWIWRKLQFIYHFPSWLNIFLVKPSKNF